MYKHTFFIFTVIFTLGTLVSLPVTLCGLPYFNDMDEQRHQKEIVQMIKEGRWDPNYYNKPALHFYFRMIPTILTYFYLIYWGKLKSFDNIITSSPFAIGELSCSSNPPEILLANRLFSLLLSLTGIFTVSVLLLKHLNTFCAWLFALTSILSRAFVELSYKLSVEPIGYFFVILCVLTSYTYYLNKDQRYIMLSSVMAGLAISTKYNLAPFAAIPLLLSFFSRDKWFLCLKNLGFIVLVFVIINPFLILNYRDFLDDLTVQIVHYRSAVENSFNQRLWLNFLWIAKNLPLYFLPGIILGILQKSTRGFSLVVSLVCLLYFFQMTAFKQLFYRNFFPMLPVLNFISILGVDALSKTQIGKKILFLLSIHLPFLCLKFLLFGVECFDSRKVIDEWLAKSNQKTYISGQLCFRAKSLKHYAVEVLDENKFSFEKIASEGGRYIILSSARNLNNVQYYKPVAFLTGRPIQKADFEFGVPRFSFIPVFNPPILILKLDIYEFLKYSEANDKIPFLDVSKCQSWCLLQHSLTKINVFKATNIIFYNPHPKPNLLNFFCKNKILKLKVNKTRNLSLNDIPCHEPIVYVRDLFRPTKYYIPDDNLIGIKVRTKH